MADTEKLVRITILMNRRKGTTEEQFRNHWLNIHGPLASEWLQRNKVIKYVQYHTTPTLRAPATRMAAVTGRSPLEFDGMVDFYVRKYEDFEEAFKDSFYISHVHPDEKDMIDMESTLMTVGTEYVCIDREKIVLEKQEL